MGDAGLLSSVLPSHTTPSSPSHPHLRKTKTSSQLIVNGEPFLMLSGELHNSSLSSAAFMADVWPNMRAANINTLLGSVSWEMIEPVEDQFDFAELDKVILGAREHQMKLVLLWFGSFKNALSTYAPAWVKKDVKRFPRVHIKEAGDVTKTLELVSPFNPRAWEADAKAFGRLLAHLREFDSQHGTVVMIQVENETGLLGDSRDRSKIAEKAFKSPVPKDVLLHLQTQFENSSPYFQRRFPKLQTLTAGEATWEEAFVDRIDAEEMFMADAFSRYVGHVAAAGKKEYPIPLYTNVWLNFDDPSILDLQGLPVVVGGGHKAGIYPSGGPCPHTMDVWKYHTPALDFIAPDLYFHDYETVCQQYRHQNQPLFIPEQRRDEKGIRRTWLAYGTYLALGCSPFGIDSLEASVSPVTRHYGLLHSMRHQILDAQANRPEDIMGFFFDEMDEVTSTSKGSWVREFGSFEVTIDRSFVFGTPGAGAGLIIHQGDGKFLLVGWGFQVTFRSTDPRATFTGILYSEEKIVGENGELTTDRVMNGDETRSGAFYIMPNEEPDYGKFPIAVTIPSRTMVAECTAYSIVEEDDDY
ncbi:glycoside hydrolase [Phlyctema vagabunda]|uniref:Glycoside hydrolase n=1 Tax=Phlyctema vagabunda TaxID=108571 RepID=A0ABR4P833_9HELO